MSAASLTVLRRKARRIRLLLMDVDGVLTDGLIYLDGEGREVKAFHIHDGLGLVHLQSAGVRVGLISGRASRAAGQRAKELGITEVHQGVDDKVKCYEALCRRWRLTDPDVAMMGDDLNDLPLLTRVGLALAPADAVAEVRAAADYVTRRAAGRGAVREAADLLLRARVREPRERARIR